MTEASGTDAGSSRTIQIGQVLGVPIWRVGMADALARLEELLDRGEPSIVVTPDASGIVRAQTDAELMGIYRRAALSVPDSEGVAWALSRDSGPIRRLPGVEMVEELLKIAERRGSRIYLLGAAPGVAEKACEGIRQICPNCCFVGARHGFFQPEEDLAVAQEVALAKPDILLVAMGIPRQEKFIARTMSIIGASVAIGVGGSLDVFSGTKQRAPLVFRKMRLEWFWRVLLDPTKIAKLKVLPRFVGMVLRSKR